MKKIILGLFIGIISVMIFPFSDVEAKVISSLNVTTSNNKMNVKGTTEDGVLAVAVLVYSEDDLIHMETCSSIDNKYSCELVKTFELGNYTVKVADYDGGEYFSKNINIKEENVNNPRTIDNIFLYLILGLMSVIGIASTTIILKKHLTKSI